MKREKGEKRQERFRENFKKERELIYAFMGCFKKKMLDLISWNLEGAWAVKNGFKD